MDWFPRVALAVDACSPPTAAIPLRSLIALCRAVATGYPLLYSDGVISKVLTDDLFGNVGRLEAVCAELETATPPGSPPPTLAHLCAWPGPPPPAGSPPLPPPTPHLPGPYGARWVARTLRFVVLLLHKLGADPALSISAAGRDTYSVCIAPFHAPVMAWVVGFILRWAPRRQWVLDHSLGGVSSAEAAAACTALSEKLRPVAEGMGEALAAAALDYQDKISAIPGGW